MYEFFYLKLVGWVVRIMFYFLKEYGVFGLVVVGIYWFFVLLVIVLVLVFYCILIFNIVICLLCYLFIVIFFEFKFVMILKEKIGVVGFLCKEIVV